MGILPMSFPSTPVCRITGIALALPSHLSEQVRPGSTGEWGQKNELPSFKIQKSHSRGTHSDQQILLEEETASPPAPVAHFTFGARAPPEARTLEWRL